MFYQSKIEVKKIEVISEKVRIFFKVSGYIKKFFREEIFFIDYEENIEDIPKGILIIPFVTDIIPIIWITNSQLIIDEIDKNFYESLNEIKKAYINMYPEANFLGELKVNKIIDYSYEVTEKVCQLFSGGVDSVATYISVNKQKPDLITIWGSDIKIENIDGWKIVEKSVREFAKENNVKSVIIKSNFRKIYSTHKLNKVYRKVLKDNWWHGVQHGIALLGLVVPYAYKNRLKTIYIPSSFSIHDKNVRCASYPTIDEALKYGSGKVIHEGFEYIRQDKVKIISDYIKNVKNIQLRVCWEGDDGKNCSRCEKCLRTIVGLYLEDIDPNQVGFNIDKNQIKKLIFSKKLIFNEHCWEDLQEILRKKSNQFQKEEWINWLLNINIKEKNKEQKNNNESKLLKKIKKILKMDINILGGKNFEK